MLLLHCNLLYMCMLINYLKTFLNLCRSPFVINPDRINNMGKTADKINLLIFVNIKLLDNIYIIVINAIIRIILPHSYCIGNIRRFIINIIIAIVANEAQVAQAAPMAP